MKILKLLALYAEGRRNFSGVKLKGESIQDLDLTGIDLTRADLTRMSFYRADFTGANLSHLYARDCLFYDCLLDKVPFNEATLIRCTLNHSHFVEADFSFASLDFCGLEQVEFQGANIDHATLTGLNVSFSNGLACVGPVGVRKRMLYGVLGVDGKTVMIQAGCRFAPLDEVLKAVQGKYHDSVLKGAYLSALDALYTLLITQANA